MVRKPSPFNLFSNLGGGGAMGSARATGGGARAGIDSVVGGVAAEGVMACLLKVIVHTGFRGTNKERYQALSVSYRVPSANSGTSSKVTDSNHQLDTQLKVCAHLATLVALTDPRFSEWSLVPPIAKYLLNSWDQDDGLSRGRRPGRRCAELLLKFTEFYRL
uniref:Uncharacterized protein n=1 Tax=Solanum tuberosum TaxID=4113 RepID=M1DZL6_SOLTU